MLFIDKFAYTSALRSAHPLEKFTFAIITLIITLLIDNPLLNIAVIIIMLGTLRFKAKIPSFVLGKLMLIPLGFLLLGVITLALSFSTNANGMLINMEIANLYIGVTKSSLSLAVNTFLKSLSSIACLYFLVLTTPLVELIYILQLFKLPNIIIDLMILIYRFIFVFLETAFAIYLAQSSRWGYASFKKSINSFGILFANLWGKAFLKAQSLYTSLAARGYEKELKVLNPRYTFSKSTICLFVIMDIVLLVMSYILEVH